MSEEVNENSVVEESLEEEINVILPEENLAEGIFETLSKVNLRPYATTVTKKYEDKKTKEWKEYSFSYVSWAVCVKHAQMYDPTFNWSYMFFDEFTLNPQGLVAYVQKVPYLKTHYGVFVETEVTLKGLSKKMMLPVIDNSNKPISSPNAMDINKSIMRCLVKNLALFGLGIDMYLKDVGLEELLPGGGGSANNTGRPASVQDPEHKQELDTLVKWLNGQKDFTYNDLTLLAGHKYKQKDLNKLSIVDLRAFSTTIKDESKRPQIKAGLLELKKGGK